MIYGIGTDLCDLRRLADTLSRRGERFAEKVLGPGELQVFRARRARSEVRGIAFLGTRFAAKEAFSKAIGLGMRMPMTWRACETLNAPSGAPMIRLHGPLADWFHQRRLRALVTLTDEKDMAAAFVVIEQDSEQEKERSP
jgi:holo-[acyl-carrier protein] synthase